METNRGLTLDGLVGLAAAVAIGMINPEQLGWRIVLIVVLFVACISALRKTGWAKPPESPLTLGLNDEFIAEDSNSIRKMRPYIFVTLAVSLFVALTWPSEQTGVSIDTVLVPGSSSSSVIHYPITKATDPLVSQAVPGAAGTPPAYGPTAKPKSPRTPMPPSNISAKAE